MRIPLYVHDAGYDEAPLTWDLRGHLRQVQVLVRLRNDRVFYRDPPPDPRPRAGPQARLGCRPVRVQGPRHLGTSGPGTVPVRRPVRAGQRHVLGQAAPKLFCRGRFAGFATARHQVPYHPRHRHRLPNGRKVPGRYGCGGPAGDPDLDLIWRAYLHRFDIEQISVSKISVPLKLTIEGTIYIDQRHRERCRPNVACSLVLRPAEKAPD